MSTESFDPPVKQYQTNQKPVVQPTQQVFYQYPPPSAPSMDPGKPTAPPSAPYPPYASYSYPTYASKYPYVTPVYQYSPYGQYYTPPVTNPIRYIPPQQQSPNSGMAVLGGVVAGMVAANILDDITDP